MNNSILQECLSYIDFLKGLGYFVSLSGFNPKLDPYIDKLLNYEIHLHSVCFYLKQNPKVQQCCLINKKRLNNKEITEPYYSCCYAGVEEFVIPIIYEGEPILRINLSGYRGTLKKSERFMQRISLKCDNHFTQLYMELSPNPPRLEDIMKFIGIDDFYPLLVDGTGTTEEERLCAIRKAEEKIPLLTDHICQNLLC